MTTNTSHAPIGAPVPRYKIGYRSDEWGERSSTPGGIPDPAGAWVRYDDHAAALASAAQPERVPLTDVQIDECLPLGVAGYSALIGDDEIRAFARAVEATHGIKPAKEDKP